MSDSTSQVFLLRTCNHFVPEKLPLVKQKIIFLQVRNLHRLVNHQIVGSREIGMIQMKTQSLLLRVRRQIIILRCRTHHQVATKDQTVMIQNRRKTLTILTGNVRTLKCCGMTLTPMYQ